jgi:hypothetical protein
LKNGKRKNNVTLFGGVVTLLMLPVRCAMTPLWSGRQRAAQPDTMTGSTPGLEERYVISIVFRVQVNNVECSQKYPIRISNEIHAGVKHAAFTDKFYWCFIFFLSLHYFSSTHFSRLKPDWCQTEPFPRPLYWY